MGQSSKFFKFFGFSTALMLGIISFASYMAWQEVSVKNALIGKALEGNHTAIAILGKYEKPWKLETRVLNEALKDNPYALQILGIEIASKN